MQIQTPLAWIRTHRIPSSSCQLNDEFLDVFQAGRTVNHCRSHLPRFAQTAMHWLQSQQFPKFDPHLMNQKRRFYVESLIQGRIRPATLRRKTQSRTKPMDKKKQKHNKHLIFIYEIYTICYCYWISKLPIGSLLIWCQCVTDNRFIYTL